MVVQHNLQAMNANRMLGITTSAQSKSTEKLSSGYRINRAADDAAGLSISEKMRKQIRGLDQASTNAQDGISCVQTAEGALTEVHSMLQRMNELAVQASNGTLSNETDRQAIQDEIDQLVTEIDRVSETTKFNDIYLLKGDGSETRTKDVTTGMTAAYTTAPTKTVETIGTKADSDVANLNLYEAGGAQITKLADLKALVEVGSDGNLKLKDGKDLYTVAPDTTGQYGAQVTAKKADFAATVGKIFKVGSSSLKDSSGNEVKDADLKNYFNEDGTYKGGLYKNNDAGASTEVGAEQIKTYVNVTAGTTTQEDYEATKALEFKLHVGAESAVDNKIGVKIEAMSAKGIGVDVLSGSGLKTQDDATNAIDTISNAIQKVSSQRSALGAVQNRLEHTIANLDNVVENTTAAESRIRDTDMAEEMVTYSKNNILAQAGQSMLAQANQSTQGVLSLLQ